jgi:CRP/FNR family cyclic AMP-dependent transcriptional regulator
MKSDTKRAFDWGALIEKTGPSIKGMQFQQLQVIFSQGDGLSKVMYVKEGVVKLSVVSHQGKEAVIGLLGPGDFLGEGSVSDQPTYLATATAMTRCKVLVIPKEQMVRILHEQPAFADRFVSYILARKVRIEQDLVDQLFNSTEKRLARALLLLARYGTQEHPNTKLPHISQQTLANTIGTTRARVNVFMNKFRQLGLIDYNGGIRVHRSLLNVILHD